MKKGLVLVTGSGGFNGRYTLELLLREGYRVRATDLELGERTAERSYYDSLGVEFVPSDLTRPKTLRQALEGVKHIMHTASLFDYSATLEDNNRINVDGGRNLLEAAVAAGVEKLILWSTMGVYGNQEIFPVTEENPINPGNDYEISKVAQEELFLDYARNGKIAVAIMRPSPIYGPGNRYGFINIIKLSAIGPIIPVPMKFDVRLPSVHVKDVTRAGVFLLEAPDNKTNGEIFNVMDDSNIKLPDFLHFVAGMLGKPAFIINMPLNKNIIMELGHATARFSAFGAKNFTHKRPVLEDATINYLAYNYIFSNDKIKKLGFKFEYPDIRVGLIEMFDWIREENYEPMRLFA